MPEQTAFCYICREISGLASRGEMDGARRELEVAVKLAPGFAKAQYELGMVLYQRGETDAAVEHLQAAAKGGDADAAGVLQKLGK